MIRHYDSPAALALDYEQLTAGKSLFQTDSYTGRSWYNGESIADSLRFARTGNASLVPAAEALISKIDTAIVTPRRVIESAVAGAFVHVPSAIVGLPRTMRRIHYESTETAPITVIATATSSAGISSEILAQRGAAILALVLALSRQRALSLYVADVHCNHAAAPFLPSPRFADCTGRDGETAIFCRINTAPLDLATACYALTSSGFCRRLCYEISNKINGYRNATPNHSDSYRADLARRAGFAAETTLFISAAHLYDPIVDQPLLWINDQIRRLTATDTTTATATATAN